MLPILLTFGWFPLFFFFMARFTRQCRSDSVQSAEDSGDRWTHVAMTDAARGNLRFAFTLPVVLAMTSAGLYVGLALGMWSWAIVFLVGGAIALVAAQWLVRLVAVGARFDENEVCSVGARKDTCLSWSAIDVVRFDSTSACYQLVGTPSGGSVAAQIKVSMVARGITDFEAAARARLGDGIISKAFDSAAQRRAALHKQR